VDEMFKLFLTSKSFALIACVTLLASAIGCNSGSIVSTDKVADTVVMDPSFILILSTSKGFDSPMLNSESASGLVSAELGGSVSNGWVTLDFPAGALDEDTEISISMPDPGKLIVELEPHGIQFNEPVGMTFNLIGTDAEDLSDEACLLWFNDEMGWWEKLDTEASDDNRCNTFLKHFSKYGSEIVG
jgi:hypothetical protein